MVIDLGKMTREERILSYQLLAYRELDPNLIARLKYQLLTARNQMKAAINDTSVPLEVMEQLDNQIRTYGKLLAVAVKMDLVDQTKDDVFAQANIQAQEEEAKKQAEESVIKNVEEV